MTRVIPSLQHEMQPFYRFDSQMIYIVVKFHIDLSGNFASGLVENLNYRNCHSDYVSHLKDSLVWLKTGVTVLIISPDPYYFR